MVKKWDSSEWLKVEATWGDLFTLMALIEWNKFEITFEMSKIG